MRLHRLTLRSVKGVRERTVEFPDRGIVVVEGPNEIGKSTMLEAFDALLTFKSSSKAAEVRALKPVDRDEGPFVEAELTVGGTRLVFAKQWLRHPSTTLHVLGDRPEQLTGDLAQTRVDTLLRTHLDRTLFDALRLTQSGDGTLAPLASSSVLTEALDAAAGARLHSDGADALLDEVEKEYRLYFTATGRTTGDYRAAMTRHTEAQHALAEAHRRVEEGRDLVARQEEARTGAAAADAAVEQARSSLARAEQAAAAAELVAQAHQVALEELGAAQELHRAAVRTQRQRAGLVEEARTLTSSLRSARQAREADLEAAERLQEELEAADEKARLAGVAVEQASDAVDAARQAADVLADVRELEGAEGLLRRARELVEHVRRAQEAQPTRPVERAEARRVRGLQDRLDALVLQHAAGSPSLEIESLGSDVEVTLADGGVCEPLVPGAARRLNVSHDTTVEVPGQARIRVLLHQEALGRVAQISEARRALDAALAELGVNHVDEVDTLAERTQDARDRLREARRDAEALLGPVSRESAAEASAGRLPAALPARVERARRRVEAHAVGGGADSGVPSDELAARAAVERSASALRAARGVQRAAATALADRRQAVVALTRRLDQGVGRLEADEARLATLTGQIGAARTEASDEELAERVATLAERVATATARVTAAADAVARADVEGARAALSEAIRRAHLAESRREEARALLHSLAGQVAMAASEGRQELYDLAATDLDEAERELRAVDRRARAARHLRTALHQHRDEAHRLYVRPFTAALEQLGHQVYGPGFSVSVDDQLTLTARTLDGVTVPYGDLSGGAKEQLGILARLAVARLVDRAHGCPVVIDDALGYSDPDRLRLVGKVLGSTVGTEGDLQVILLTCTPDRYAAIPHVRTVRLSA